MDKSSGSKKMPHKNSLSHSMADLSEHSESVLRVGIVGCGRVARYHIQFVSEIKYARVVGLVDQDETTARRLGELYGVQHIDSSLEGLLESTTIDVLHILTPPTYHYAQAVAAIDHGLHVLIEKPCALSTQDAVDL